MAYTTQQILEKNQQVRDECLDWIQDITGKRDEEMLGIKSNAITQMYNAACGEIKRCENILAAKEENAIKRQGYQILFQDSDEAPREQLRAEA